MAQPKEMQTIPLDSSGEITGRKADVPECALEGCNRVGVLIFAVTDTVSVYTTSSSECLTRKPFCCKTHMLRFLQKVPMPRYSKKRVQRLAGTLTLTLTNVDGKIHQSVKREAPEPK